MDAIVANLQNNVLQIMMNAQKIYAIMKVDDYPTDEDVFQATNEFMEAYGSILSYVFGFDKKFTVKKLSKKTKLALSFL